MFADIFYLIDSQLFIALFLEYNMFIGKYYIHGDEYKNMAYSLWIYNWKLLFTLLSSVEIIFLLFREKKNSSYCDKKSILAKW